MGMLSKKQLAQMAKARSISLGPNEGRRLSYLVHLGLIDKPQVKGKGRGRGTQALYPERVLEQLAALDRLSKAGVPFNEMAAKLKSENGNGFGGSKKTDVPDDGDRAGSSLPPPFIEGFCATQFLMMHQEVEVLMQEYTMRAGILVTDNKDVKRLQQALLQAYQVGLTRLVVGNLKESTATTRLERELEEQLKKTFHGVRRAAGFRHTRRGKPNLKPQQLKARSKRRKTA
jgi:hypothetical protein